MIKRITFKTILLQCIVMLPLYSGAMPQPTTNLYSNQNNNALQNTITNDNIDASKLAQISVLQRKHGENLQHINNAMIAIAGMTDNGKQPAHMETLWNYLNNVTPSHPTKPVAVSIEAMIPAAGFRHIINSITSGRTDNKRVSDEELHNVFWEQTIDISGVPIAELFKGKTVVTLRELLAQYEELHIKYDASTNAAEKRKFQTQLSSLHNGLTEYTKYFLEYAHYTHEAKISPELAKASYENEKVPFQAYEHVTEMNAKQAANQTHKNASSETVYR